MSSDDETSSDDEEYIYESSEDEDLEYVEELSEEDEELSAEDYRLFAAVTSDDANAAAAAIENGANVNAVRNDCTPLFHACRRGYDQIIRILLDAGVDAKWKDDAAGWSAAIVACIYGHLSTVQLLINHDNGLLEIATNHGCTPLFVAAYELRSDLVQFLLESGAYPHHVSPSGHTALIFACLNGSSLEVVRLLIAAGVDVEATNEDQQTALHSAAVYGRIEVVRELILQHNANMLAVDRFGRTPFDAACYHLRGIGADIDRLLEVYGDKLTQDYGRLALHELLKVAEYSFAEDENFHPPLNPFRIIQPMGKLTWKYLRTLLRTMDPELIRNRDDTGKVPIHIACQTNAPVEVLALILELDPAALHIADFAGALPIHLLCGTTASTDYASVRYLVEQGGVGTLAARNRRGLLPLHIVSGSTNPSLRVVQYLIQSFPKSVATQTNAGQYPFMIAAAAESSPASLSVIYEIVRANPDLVVPR